MLGQLPAEARIKAELRGGEEYLGWTQDRYINVAIFNVLQQLLYVQAQSKTKTKVPKPTPIPVPDNNTAPKPVDNTGFEAMLARAKANKAKTTGE